MPSGYLGGGDEYSDDHGRSFSFSFIFFVFFLLVNWIEWGTVMK